MSSPPAAGPTHMTASPRLLDVTFTAPIEKDGSFPTFLTVPDSAELLGTRRAVKVTGTIDDHPFAATLMPSGEGPHWLPRRTLLRADQEERLVPALPDRPGPRGALRLPPGRQGHGHHRRPPLRRHPDALGRGAALAAAARGHLHRDRQERRGRRGHRAPA